MSDLEALCKNLKDAQPPYKCPVESCDKILKNFTGAKIHIHKFHNCRSKQLAKRKVHLNYFAAGNNGFVSPKKVVNYIDTQEIFKIYIEGKLCQLNINDRLKLIDVEESQNDCYMADIWNCGKVKRVVSSTCRNTRITSTNISKNSSFLSPEPLFRIVDNYDCQNMPARPSTFYRYDEDIWEDISKEVEYDMDDEDVAWLSLVNEKRRRADLSEVNEDVFELLIDRLEKESFRLCHAIAEETLASMDENAVCCICNDGDCDDSNVIIFCDECNLSVHQECYGVPFIPEGQWLCRRCSHSPSLSIECVLCPNKDGAFKPTDDGRWAHVICALWIPEVGFSNPNFLEPIDSLQKIPRARWKLCCYICKKRNSGACIQCKKNSCYTAFHVTCAQNVGLFMEMKAVKVSGTDDASFEIQKSAFCILHTPDISSSKTCEGDETEDSSDQPLDGSKTTQTLTELTVPVTLIPNISPGMLTQKMKSLNIHLDQNFIERVVAFWKLKRQSRGGAPLLRRLQLTVYPKQKQDSVAANKPHDETEVCQLIKLRQDFERVRLLLEMIRKREKMKLKLIQIQRLETSLRLQPFVVFLLRTLEKLQCQDINNVFAEPVDVSTVCDYLEFIKYPMDFATIKKKIEMNKYNHFEEFENDFNLIINNCLSYNAKDTIYYEVAVEMRQKCSTILQKAKQSAMMNHLDANTRLSSVNEASLKFHKKGIHSKPMNSYLQVDAKKNNCRHQKISRKSNHFSSTTQDSDLSTFPKNFNKISKMMRMVSDESDEENGIQTSAIAYHQPKAAPHQKLQRNDVKLRMCKQRKRYILKTSSRQLRSSVTHMSLSSSQAKVPRSLLTIPPCSPHGFSLWPNSSGSCNFMQDAGLLPKNVPISSERNKFVNDQMCSFKGHHLRK